MIPFTLLGVKSVNKDKNNTELHDKIFNTALDYVNNNTLQIKNGVQLNCTPFFIKLFFGSQLCNVYHHCCVAHLYFITSGNINNNLCCAIIFMYKCATQDYLTAGR